MEKDAGRARDAHDETKNASSTGVVPTTVIADKNSSSEAIVVKAKEDSPKEPDLSIL
jgi:hypothetical protein